jgi:hypothetical protein
MTDGASYFSLHSRCSKIRLVLTLSKPLTAGYALPNFHANYCKTDGKIEQHEYHHQHTIRIK